MASITVNRRYTAALGPVKMELIECTAPSSPDNPDTVDSLLGNPSSVTVASRNTDIGNTADPSSATVSGKTVTVHDMTASRTYLVTVVGF